MKAEKAVRSSMNTMVKFTRSRKGQKLKLHIIGRHLNDGWIAKIAILFLLSVVSYLYLQPLFYIFSTMFKSVSDLIDPTVKWIPRTMHLDNFRTAWDGLMYPVAFTNTLVIALSCSIIQVFMCAITGYGLAKFPFPGRGLITLLVMLTFIVPPQIIVLPLYIVYNKFGWLDSPLVFIVPAIFGQGMKSALFIFIFRQFFKAQPASLEEAAMLDGASVFRMFFRIMLPLARSACLVVFLFSFIWYWNMHYEAAMFLPKSYPTLAISLNRMEENLAGLPLRFATVTKVDPMTEGIKMAGAFLIIIPPLLIYMIAQRWFVRGIERSGIIE
ncbi:ABC transporter permease [Paenibacillus baekrokdamisoli]|uniref:ABC transporter permease n=1 Tax=Paenibacillus baekrokdamisoli TaxID=1712516 RepID=A0A3G9JDT3_9BACL|nr:carbohydrate ABC transporter permease [Paenibacillus baekrokdamisoli]MBB3070903.1 multiple sugar transport system permease protein [Paenibacillus baekrokdamisoli]BBH22158.1 ABC transporter permease [Paenibacillus baekrokdamisoli]